MLLGGSGVGLVSAPATEAIMGVVPKAKAGIGSASTTPPDCSEAPSHRCDRSIYARSTTTD